MNLLQHVNAALHSAAASVNSAWHDHVEPWLSNFLKNTAKAEVEALIPLATTYVQQAVPALVSAIASGNTQGYADAQWDAIVATADQAKKTALTVAITSVSTAVNVVIASHPSVLDAQAKTTAPAQ